MSREKQIEEMAINELSMLITCVDIETEPEGTCCRMNFDQADTMACALYNAGYRKQSENTVEVVRCKDCIHARNMPLGLCYLHTEPYDNAKGYKGDAVCVEPNDFCSYGEQKMKGGAE